MNHRPVSLRLVAALLAVAGLIGGGCADTLTAPSADEAVFTDMEGAGKKGAGNTRNSEPEASYVILFNPAMDTAEVTATAKRIVRKYGLRKRHVYKYNMKGVAGEMTPGNRRAMLEDPEEAGKVLKTRPDLPFVVENNPGNGGGGGGQKLPWGIDHVEADLSSTAAGDGQGSVPVDVYVIDSGVSHGDVDVVEALDFRSIRFLDPSDSYGHGTHIAGTIAAIDDNKDVVGTAPGARIHSLKVLFDNGAGQFSDVLAALDYVSQQKAENPGTPMVVNLSLGADVGTTDATIIDEGVQHAIDQGITVVVAAGNDGVNVETVTPAHVEAAITVGAYDPASQFAPFSNFGAGVDILAPGVEIESLYPKGNGKVMSGTSMAAAHVTGAAALYLSQYPQATPEEVRSALLGAALPSVLGTPVGTTNLRLSMLTF